MVKKMTVKRDAAHSRYFLRDRLIPAIENSSAAMHPNPSGISVDRRLMLAELSMCVRFDL